MKKTIYLGLLVGWLMSPPKSSSPVERNAASASSSASNSPAASPNLKPEGGDLQNSKMMDHERFFMYCVTNEHITALPNRELVLALMSFAYSQAVRDQNFSQCRECIERFDDIFSQANNELRK